MPVLETTATTNCIADCRWHQFLVTRIYGATADTTFVITLRTPS